MQARIESWHGPAGPACHGAISAPADMQIAHCCEKDASIKDLDARPIARTERKCDWTIPRGIVRNTHHMSESADSVAVADEE